MAAIAGILFFQNAYSCFSCFRHTQQVSWGKKKERKRKQACLWGISKNGMPHKFFIYFSHDMSPHQIPWKKNNNNKKDRCTSWCVVKFSTMSYMGNQAHAQLCIVWTCIEKKSHSLWASTLHNKIRKWMINSKRTQKKHPNFTPSKPPQMKKWVWQQQWRRNYKNKIEFSSVALKKRL